MAASSSFDSCLLSLCKNPLEEYFEVIINWNHHPEEEVSYEPSREKEKTSEVKHLNQYRYHSHMYLGRPSELCGCYLQVVYDLRKIFWLLSNKRYSHDKKCFSNIECTIERPYGPFHVAYTQIQPCVHHSMEFGRTHKFSIT